MSTEPIRDLADLTSDQIAEIGVRRIRATPFTWPEPKHIPPRRWLFGRWLLRGEVTAIIAPGGIGKSTLISGIALSLASGREFLGKTIWEGPLRVWVWNLEDDSDEIDRSLTACRIHHGITQEFCPGELFRDSGLTRIPVYDGTLDTPTGFVHLKDFALIHGFNGGTTEFDLDSMLRPLLFVPPSMPIGVLLAKMQNERRHMALVIDEYGGVDGLLTIEDLIEQVVGEIEDEHDTDEDQTWVKEKPGQYIALAKTPLEEFEAEIGQSLTDHDEVDEEEIDTLGGLVFMLSGRVPARGEVVSHPDGPEFEVMDADPRRIKRLRVRLPGPAA